MQECFDLNGGGGKKDSSALTHPGGFPPILLFLPSRVAKIIIPFIFKPSEPNQPSSINLIHLSPGLATANTLWPMWRSVLKKKPLHLSHQATSSSSMHAAATSTKGSNTPNRSLIRPNGDGRRRRGDNKRKRTDRPTDHRTYERT